MIGTILQDQFAELLRLGRNSSVMKLHRLGQDRTRSLSMLLRALSR
jgi:hypothetical protein